MAGSDDISEGMEVIGADGVHVGTVDRIEGDRIKLTKKDSGQGSHEGHHHYLSTGLVAEVEGDQVRLSANGDVAVSLSRKRKQAPRALAAPNEKGGTVRVPPLSVYQMCTRCSGGR